MGRPFGLSPAGFYPESGSPAVSHTAHAWLTHALAIIGVILLCAIPFVADHMPDNTKDEPPGRDEDESRQEAADVRLAA